MPVTFTITDANDAPWEAAPILNEMREIITITLLWKQERTKNMSCPFLMLKEGGNYNVNLKTE